MKKLSEKLTAMKTIHRGNLATCYRAKELTLDRDVFVKILHADYCSDPEMRARFLREARTVARLDHPNLVHIFEFGEDPDHGLYMILEWVDGISLAQQLRKQHALSSSEVRLLARHLFQGLHALHSVGIVHRDIKPENLLLRNDGIYKVSDFSLAILQDEPRLTHHNAIVGTPAYMSPEQAAGRPADARSDIFSAGTVIFEAAIGENPFAAEDMLDTMRRIRQLTPSFDDLRFEALDPDLRALIRHCLEKDIAVRVQSAENALRIISEPAEQPGTQRIRPHKKWVGLAATGFFLIVLFILLLPIFESQSLRDTETITLDTSAVLDRSSDYRDSSAANVDQVPIVREKATNLPEAIQSGPESVVPNADVQKRTGGHAPLADSLASMRSDCLDVYLEVEPWAHVSCNGVRLGTTPLKTAVRLPAGRQNFAFEHSAFPRVDIPIEIRAEQDTVQINLAMHITTLELSVSPWGTVYFDNELVGTTPLNHPLFFIPGTHHLRITHPEFPVLEKTIQSDPGDTLIVGANMNTSELTLKSRHDYHD